MSTPVTPAGPLTFAEAVAAGEAAYERACADHPADYGDAWHDSYRLHRADAERAARSGMAHGAPAAFSTTLEPARAGGTD